MVCTKMQCGSALWCEILTVPATLAARSAKKPPQASADACTKAKISLETVCRMFDRKLDQARHESAVSPVLFQCSGSGR